MRQDRRHQHSGLLQHVRQHCLARASSQFVLRRDVQSVFGDVQVERRELCAGELQKRLVDVHELVFIVRSTDIAHKGRKLSKHVLVQRGELLVRHRVQCGVEVPQTAQHIAHRVADLAAALADLLHDVAAHAHIASVIHARCPQAKCVGSKCWLFFLVPTAVDDLHRVDHIAQRLGHLVASLVQHEAVRQHCLVRCDALRGHGGQQRALKPAAVLVRPFQVHVRGVVQRRCLGCGCNGTCLQHTCPGCTRIEPHIHRVCTLGELTCALSQGTRWQQTRNVHLPPCIRAMLCEDSFNVLQRLGCHERLVGGGAVEHWDGHSPGPLPRDAPVASGLRHGGDAGLAGGGDPLHLVDGLQGGLPEGRDTRKPLLRRTKDRGLLGPPVIRILVAVGLFLDEHPCLLECLNHGNIAFFQNIQADEALSGLHGELAQVVDGREQRQVVLEAGEVILLTMSGGRVHQARA
mmetsp:Transcript_62733/g.110794  ORF Transcript_62733/g.110794 Transcript_62733/m.110794 type:complete len:462 (-) Transcript_62733:1175-2560(-)